MTFMYACLTHGMLPCAPFVYTCATNTWNASVYSATLMYTWATHGYVRATWHATYSATVLTSPDATDLTLLRDLVGCVCQ